MGYVPSVAVTILKKNVVVKFLKMKKTRWIGFVTLGRWCSRVWTHFRLSLSVVHSCILRCLKKKKITHFIRRCHKIFELNSALPMFL